jgi:hypothetical protein
VIDTTHLLFSALPVMAGEGDWEIYPDPDLEEGSSLKYGARRRTGEGAIVKPGWAGIALSEFLWYRMALTLFLPVAPVQFIPIPEHPLRSADGGMPFGSLIHIIAPSQDAPWLWRARTQDIEAAGINPNTVGRLKAVALWGTVQGGECGEFRLTEGGLPFIVDCQDFLRLRSNGLPVSPPADEDSVAAQRIAFIVDSAQARIAVSVWRQIQDLSEELASICYKLPRNELACMVLASMTIVDPDESVPQHILDKIATPLIPALADGVRRLAQGWTSKLIERIQAAGPCG